jgi:phage baseplate assembly protein W
MAFNIEKINPLDLQPRKVVGVRLPFSSRDVFTPTYTTREALKSNLINFLLTNKQERYLNPDFGANIRSLLFEQLTVDVLDVIDSTIRRGIEIWFNNVSIIDLTVAEDLNSNTVVIYMKYGVNFTNIEDELLINFQQ